MSNCCEIKASDVKCCENCSCGEGVCECSCAVTLSCDCSPGCCSPQSGEAAEKRCC